MDSVTSTRHLGRKNHAAMEGASGHGGTNIVNMVPFSAIDECAAGEKPVPKPHGKNAQAFRFPVFC
jgi:hypothetical protein